MAKREPLGVWLSGARVAELTSTKPAQVVCRYTADALDRWPANVPLLSCSLPLSARAADAAAFFSGLLPEGQHRQAMAAEANVASYDTFGLLERFGRDVAGAIVVSREDPVDRPGSYKTYSPTGLAQEVAALPDRPLGIHDDSELSIAGLQNKLLLVQVGKGHWGRPIHGLPSTHILKVEDRRFPGLVEAEASCLRLARSVGLTTVDASVEDIAGVPCIIVSRFDRRRVGKAVVRVHQEDACQALGRDFEAARGKGKYQAHGGPTLREVADLLDRYASSAEHELAKLASAVAFTVCIGNADAHGKNVALLHREPGVIELAPLYDTVPTVLWGTLRRRAAMTIGGKLDLDKVGPADVVREAAGWHLSPAVAEASARNLAERLLDALDAEDVVEPVRDLVRERTERFLRRG